MLGYRDREYKKYISTNADGENCYAKVTSISALRYGPSRYVRGLSEELIKADYIYHTNVEVFDKDKIDDLIVTSVNKYEHPRVYWEVSVSNG